MGKKKWTDDKLNKFKEMYLDVDIAAEDIAKEFGLTKQGVYSTAKNHNITRNDIKRFKVTDNVKRIIEAKLLEGVTMPECAKFFRTTEQTLRKEMKKAGMKGYKVEVPEGKKFCTVCRQILDRDMFHNSKAKLDGKDTLCKVCKSEKNRRALINKRMKNK